MFWNFMFKLGFVSSEKLPFNHVILTMADMGIIMILKKHSEFLFFWWPSVHHYLNHSIWPCTQHLGTYPYTTTSIRRLRVLQMLHSDIGPYTFHLGKALKTTFVFNWFLFFSFPYLIRVSESLMMCPSIHPLVPCTLQTSATTECGNLKKTRWLIRTTQSYPAAGPK